MAKNESKPHIEILKDMRKSFGKRLKELQKEYRAMEKVQQEYQNMGKGDLYTKYCFEHKQEQIDDVRIKMICLNTAIEEMKMNQELKKIISKYIEEDIDVKN